MPSERELYTELEAIRKGRGVQEPQLRNRIGPGLRSLCGISVHTSHGDARRALIATLAVACNDLSAELKLAAQAMFAIADGYHHRFLRQRYDALAAKWNCDFRTVQRRCDEALGLISAELWKNGEPARPVPATTDVFNPDAWYLERLNTVLLLNRKQPEVIEERTIVATTDGLARIGMPFGVLRHPEEVKPQVEVDVELLYGARLDSVQHPVEDMFIHYLELPRPLRHGERHTYARIVRIPTDQLMVPRYVHLPLNRCDLFELRVKFDNAALPRVVWLVSQIPEKLFTTHRPGKDLIEPDALGEVHVKFTDLRLGFGYGLSWLPAMNDHE